MQQLRGRTVVITGAGSGIGRGTALSFAREGANVVIADVKGERAETVAGEVRELGVSAAALACDVVSDRDFESLRDLTLERFGRVDVVMNNVGVIAAGLPLNIPLAEWQRIIDVNLLSLVRSNAVFLPLLLEQGEGHVVNTASTAALYPYTYDRLPYGATKAAVLAVSEGLALYLRPRGVGVTVLCPGPVLTNIVEQMAFHGELGDLRGPTLELLDPADVGDMVVQAVRDDRFLLLTHPEEVHEILVRKATDPEAFMDAQVATITGDGG
jgi:NAD(P)-dependent dehydrogenase (short-subunit alcohol dehydrogenase family)